MTSTERALRLMDGKLTVKELAFACFCTYNTLAVQLKQLHKRGKIHIAGYKQTFLGGPQMILYAAGPGVDAKKKTPIKPVERWRKRMESLTAYERDQHLNRRNTRRRKIKVDPMTAAFFGGKT